MKNTTSKLRVMLVDETVERTTPLKEALTNAGHEVVAHVADALQLNKIVAEFQPDVIIIDTDSPSRDTLEHICVVSRDDPRPIVMFTHDGDTEKIREATRSGVSAYVVGGISNAKLKPVLDAAIVRFEEFQALRNELQTATIALADRKSVERAKGILMKQRNIDEEAAYNALRKMAMERGTKIGEIAKQIIQAYQLLS